MHPYLKAMTSRKAHCLRPKPSIGKTANDIEVHLEVICMYIVNTSTRGHNTEHCTGGVHTCIWTKCLLQISALFVVVHNLLLLPD